mmetsp:Transcript_12367/g.23730  ORF Transcript_12367/g.23730 Transcript_12367/m.23730 type:complete len:101 (-) Transcript_12367:762-1064(-)
MLFLLGQQGAQKDALASEALHRPGSGSAQVVLVVLVVLVLLEGLVLLNEGLVLLEEEGSDVENCFVLETQSFLLFLLVLPRFPPFLFFLVFLVLLRSQFV